MKHILSILLSLVTLAAFAQNATVQSVVADPLNISASKYPMTDLNGHTAPLVIVRVLADNVEFKGSVLNGGVVRKTGEYWVYMGSGAKMLHIHSDKFLPVEIHFPNYGIPRLESSATYIVTLALPQAATPAATQQRVDIKFSPADAIVLIDGQIIKSANGVATAALTADRDYSYTVTAYGYIAQQGAFRLNPAVPTRLNIELSPDPSLQGAPQSAPQPAPQPASQFAAPQFPTTPVHLALCAAGSDGCAVYITAEQWKTLSSSERASYTPKGVCLSQDGEPFLVELRDKEKGTTTWKKALKYNLPTKAQSEVLVNNKEALNSAMKAFGGIIMDRWYWTKTEDENNASYAWGVGMLSGHVGTDNKGNPNRVRAVAPAPVAR